MVCIFAQQSLCYRNIVENNKGSNGGIIITI